MKKRSTSIRRRISILAAACLMVTLCGTAMAAGQSYTHTFKPPHGKVYGLHQNKELKQTLERTLM